MDSFSDVRFYDPANCKFYYVLWGIKEIQILQFALDKQKGTYEHKRIYSKLNSLFSYFMMEPRSSTEAITMITSRGE